MTVDTIVFETKNGKTSIALLKNGELRELEIIDDTKAQEGNIYLGKINSKIALANDKEGYFIDISDGKDGFLNAEEYGMNTADYTEGQSLIVQISQERRAEKGARLTRSLQFVGANIVYCPFQDSVTASSKIANQEAVNEYKNFISENMTGEEGWILRTGAIDSSFEEIKEEMDILRNLYESIRLKARNAKAPSLLYAKPNPLLDHIQKHAQTLQKVVINSHNIEDEVKENFEIDFELEYQKEPFKEMLIDEAIFASLNKEVHLRDGGRITIEETKAFVAIDVDSGNDRGNGSISRLNNDAAFEIAKQIKLRNLSGKIIIDFAGQSDYKYLQSAIEILEKECARDYIKTTVLGLSKGGNVEILRTRRRPSLRDLLTVDCQTCQGTGRVEE